MKNRGRIKKFRHFIQIHSSTISISLNLSKTPYLPTSLSQTSAKPSQTSLTKRTAEKPSINSLEHFFRFFLSHLKPESPKSPTPISVHAGKFGEFLLDPRIFPTLPMGVSQKAFLKELGLKIQAGASLYSKIAHRKLPSKPAQLEDISNLIWFFQAKAEQKEGPFLSGTLSIEDSDLSLLAYFDSCKKIYQIESMELTPSANKEPYPISRGLDFMSIAYDPAHGLHSYLQTVLPHEKHTLIIIPMLKESKLVEKNRLLLKLEDHIIYNHIFRKGDKVRSAREIIESSFPNVISQAWPLIQSLIKISTGSKRINSKKESVPFPITYTYGRFIQEFKKHKLTEFLEILQKDSPLFKSGGIRIMARNIENLTLLSSDPNFPSHLTKSLNDFYNIITDHNTYDYYSVRIGNEIIFSTKDLLSNPKQSPET